MAFERKACDDRKTEVDKVREEWSKRFIVLPNPTYGEWENAVYDYEKNLPPLKQEEKRKAKLKGY
jgi:predicted secreted acid phosphatase